MSEIYQINYKFLASEDCQNPQVKHLLTGQRRKTPWTVVDLPSGMGGGARQS